MEVERQRSERTEDIGYTLVVFRPSNVAELDIQKWHGKVVHCRHFTCGGKVGT